MTAIVGFYCTYFLQHVPQEQGVLDEVWNKLFMGVFGTLAHGAENRSVCGIHKTVVHELYEYVVRYLKAPSVSFTRFSRMGFLRHERFHEFEACVLVSMTRAFS